MTLRAFAIALLSALLAACDRTPAPPAPVSSDPPTVSTAPAPSPPTAEGSDLRQAGQRIVGEAFSVLSSNLLAALTRSGPANALEFCSVNVAPLTAGVAVPQGVDLRRVTHRPRNAGNLASPTELELIRAYQAGLLAGRTNPPVLVTNLSGQVTFYAPIVLGNPLCLQCHGLPQAEIARETLEAIDRLYPADQARGFRLNELRGLWAVSFTQDSSRPFNNSSPAVQTGNAP